MSAAFIYEDGFHRADWSIIREWIESNIAPTEIEEAWNEAALLWLTKLRDDLGGDYFIAHSRQTLLLCDQALGKAQWLLDYAGRGALTVKEFLGDVAWSGALGKDVVLIFSDEDDYYQYLSYHSVEGEQAKSGGVCIDSGYTHIALPWQDELDAANAIIHELTHDCLAHLPLPLWLNESIALTIQKAIAPPPRSIGQSDQAALFSASINWQPPIMWDDLAEKHFAFWNETNIQSFWAGTSFYQPGDPNQLSYNLAEVIGKLLLERGTPNSFREFVKVADRSDAGQTAAINIFGVDLGEIAGTFLGEGDWRPKRKAMIECWN